MSGYTSDVIVHYGVLDPGLDYVQKPFGPESLVTKVRASLDAARPRNTILLVDDSTAIRKLLSEILTGAGYTVLEAADEQEAEQLIGTREVNLLLTDLYLPGKGGIALVRDLRVRHPDLKIIIMSAAFGGDIPAQAQVLGVDGVLAKPTLTPVLLETVARVMTA